MVRTANLAALVSEALEQRFLRAMQVYPQLAPVTHARFFRLRRRAANSRGTASMER